MKKRAPTFREISEVVREQQAKIQEELGVSKTNMFIPTDGKGLRLRICVPDDSPDDLPEEIEMCLADGSNVVIPLEITRDFRSMDAQDEP